MSGPEAFITRTIGKREEDEPGYSFSFDSHGIAFIEGDAS